MSQRDFLTPANDVPGGDGINENEVVARLAAAATIPVRLEAYDDAYVVINPVTGEHEVLDLEKHRYTPRRETGVYVPHTLDSFIRYAARHRGSTTTVWVDQLGFKITAVLNDHAPGDPQWGDHRVQLQLLQTPQWKHWTGKDGRYLDQTSFAEHIQDGLLEIVQPDGATLLEIAQTMQGKTKVDWKTATKLQNGEIQFAYQEEIEATAGRGGHLDIPAELELAISPFYGEQPSLVRARLRYRVREGVLTIGYKLDRPEELLTDAVTRIADRLTGEHGFDHVYLGTPPAGL